MKRIAELIGQELKWVQSKAARMEYSLFAGEEVAATLRIHSAWSTLATAESADGSWTFKQAGLLQTRVIIQENPAGKEIASFQNNTWRSGGTLELPDGRKYKAKPNFWATDFVFWDETGNEIFHYQKIGGLFHTSAFVTITPSAAQLPELPWMVPLGLYLVLIQQQHAAVTATVA